MLPRSARRLAWLLLGMAPLLAGLVLFAVTAHSAARAYVAGESQWSRAQKSAALALLRYLQSGDEAHYQAFEREITVPLSDRRAREAMGRGSAHDAEAARAFVDGRNHADDMPGMIRLYMADSVAIWREADGLIAERVVPARETRT